MGEGTRKQLVIWEAWNSHLICPDPLGQYLLCRVKPFAQSWLYRFLSTMQVDSRHGF